jgi:hypothetical protein
VIAFVVVGSLALAALAYVAFPLLSRTGEPGTMLSPDPTAEAVRVKSSALAAIVDLEGEHEMGKLSTEDLEVLRRQPLAEALEALRVLRGGGDLDAALEREIAQARSLLSCAACGARLDGDVCRRCGARSQAAAP